LGSSEHLGWRGTIVGGEKYGKGDEDVSLLVLVGETIRKCEIRECGCWKEDWESVWES